MSDTSPTRRSGPGAGSGSLAGRVRPDSFGADPTGERLARIRRSPQFRDGAFRNEAPVGAATPNSPLRMARDFLRRADRLRRRPTAAPPLERPAFAPAPGAAGPEPASGLRLTWLGHATVLAEIDGHRVLFDPVWGERCSPVGFAGPRRLHPAPLPLTELGRLDAVVISHDHYDHLDMPTVKALIATGAPFAVPLGVGAHLEHWGVPADRITELDWWESTTAGELTLTSTPGQHFCGRGMRNTGLTLWASWAVTGPRHRVFHSGDTGYFPGFARIGAELGPFDATMMQIGAYSSEYWPDIHMTPEEGVRAHRDLAGPDGEPGVLLPIHWGTFNLALHPWDEPAERTVAACERDGVRVVVPRPGASFEPATPPPSDTWWRTIARPAPVPAPEPRATPAPGTLPAPKPTGAVGD
ncbi:MBL fold metallo-hydrolase [Streptomyces harbinensis]|uniref:MBL fold metallo-hydrolase n=1 Tax=Streptomyces harbinensis TaxID=1176198 RepID=UPI0036BA0B77